jgi:hypothetical protein
MGLRKTILTGHFRGSAPARAARERRVHKGFRAEFEEGMAPLIDRRRLFQERQCCLILATSMIDLASCL